MSFSLDAVSLTGATAGTTGTVSWANLAQSVGYGIPEAGPPHLALLNESPCGLQLQLSTGDQMSLPAGGWQTITLNPTCTNFTYKVLYVLNASPIVSSLLGTWYAPGEPVPDAPILGNSPIGAVVPISPIANEVQGTGQINGVTEQDRTGVNAGPMLIPINLGEALWLGNGNHTAALRINGDGTLKLIAATEALSSLLVDTTLDVTGATTLSSTVHAVGDVTADGLVQALHLTATGNASIDGVIDTYNNKATAGMGVAYIAASALETPVTTTGLKTILSYTTNNSTDEYLRVGMSVTLNNGTSPQAILAATTYTNANGANAGHRFASVVGGGTTVVVLDGSTTRANGEYPCQPFHVVVQKNTTITVTYNPGANTPNDLVTASIERLA